MECIKWEYLKWNCVDIQQITRSQRYKHKKCNIVHGQPDTKAIDYGTL